MTPSLLLLRELRNAHERMALLADRLEWDELDKEWKLAQDKLDELARQPLAFALNENEKPEAKTLIEALLALQTQITGKAKPWMEQVRPLLDSFDRHPLPPLEP